jgi:carboxyl-terminal processing protease
MVRRELLVALAVVILIALSAAPAASRREDHVGDFEVLAHIVKEIEDNYVTKVDSKGLFYGALRGMVSVLDPHSTFIEPDEMSDLSLRIKGKFGGLGIEISIAEGWLTVVTPIEGSPAHKAGVAAGDKIIAIDGATTKNITLREAVNTLRGKPGTKVTIRVVHKWAPTVPEDITVERAIIKVESVRGFKRGADNQWMYMIDEEKKIGYIRLAAFQENSAASVREILDRLVEKNMAALVLDLRFNPGGVLKGAVQIADMFIRKGIIVETRGRLPSENYPFRAKVEGTLPEFPMVILINEGSASASEIVSGALQDHKRATIVGERSFGKGSVQRVKSVQQIVREHKKGRGWGGYPDSEFLKSGLKLTTARYYTPSGRTFDREYDTVSRRVTRNFMDRNKDKSDKDIEAEEKARQEKMRGGIVPDVEVKLTDEQRRELALSKRQTEIIHDPKEAKEGEKKEPEAKEGEKKEPEAKEGEKKEPEAKEGEKKEGEKGPEAEEPKKPFVDIQLQKALEILQEKLAAA